MMGKIQLIIKYDKLSFIKGIITNLAGASFEHERVSLLRVCYRFLCDAKLTSDNEGHVSISITLFTQ